MSLGAAALGVHVQVRLHAWQIQGHRGDEGWQAGGQWQVRGRLRRQRPRRHQVGREWRRLRGRVNRRLHHHREGRPSSQGRSQEGEWNSNGLVVVVVAANVIFRPHKFV